MRYTLLLACATLLLLSACATAPKNNWDNNIRYDGNVGTDGML